MSFISFELPLSQDYPLSETGQSLGAAVLDVQPVITFFGDNFNNHFFYQGSNDVLAYAYGGNDSVYTGSGNDQVDGGNGNDVINTWAGNDVLWGGAGDDFLDAGPGKDALHGESGNDILSGGSGDDELLGGEGSDSLFGNEGNDILRGESSYSALSPLLRWIHRIENRDLLTGGSGSDIFMLGDVGGNFYQGDGHAVITDFNRLEEGDRIRVKYHPSLRLESLSYGGSAALDTCIFQGSDLLGVVLDQSGKDIYASRSTGYMFCFFDRVVLDIVG
jgi:Ca2+-binding RTX toxin-like protein